MLGMDQASAEAHVESLLDRLRAVGGTAWLVGGQLRLRPLSAIPRDLLDAIRAKEKEVSQRIATRPGQLLNRVTEKRFIAKKRTDMLRDIPGKPSTAQRLMIDRIAWLSWHVDCFDRKALESGGMSAHATREYLAYSNSLERCCRHLEDMKSAARSSARSGAAPINEWSHLSTDAD